MAIETLPWIAWWQDADWIVRAVFIILSVLSVLSWTVILYKTWQLSWIYRHERSVVSHFRGGSGLDGLKRLLPEQAPSASLISEVSGLRDDGAFPASRDWLESHLSRVLRESRLEMEGGLTLLATIGNASPFIGLFGTVWGIMNALQGLGGGGALNMDMIAGPVAEALVATAAGLFAAIPAVVGYNLLLRRLRRIVGMIEGNALHVLDAMLSSPLKGA